MVDSDNILTASLAELRTYFEGWHTSNYDELHKRLTPGMRAEINTAINDAISNSTIFDGKYAPIYHANKNNTYGLGTNDLFGHVKVIDNLSEDKYSDGIVLSAHQGYELNEKINSLSSKIDNLRTPTLRIGRGRGLTQEDYDDIKNDPYGDGILNQYIGNGIDWGTGKIEARFNVSNPDRLVIQILDSYGNPMTKTRGKAFLCINGLWKLLDIGIYNGADVRKIQFATEDTTYNAVMWGDQWFFLDIFLYDTVDDTNQLYKGLYKRFLLNYGQNLWDSHVTQGNIYYRNNKPYFIHNGVEKRIRASEGPIKKDGHYFRWERDEYPYGRPLSFPDDIGIGYYENE